MRANLGCRWKYLITLFFIISVASSANANSTAGNVVINELLPNPSGVDYNKNRVISGMDDEFLELYNIGNESVDISSYNFTDLSLGRNYTIPNGTTIKPKGFWVVFSSESHVFQRNAGDDIKLFDSSGNLVDEKAYNATTPNVSFARIPDGGNWTTSKKPTPGMPNH
ncbi:MAG: lamin tail domain-containing protein [Methanotrichaceae archaeon]